MCLWNCVFVFFFFSRFKWRMILKKTSNEINFFFKYRRWSVCVCFFLFSSFLPLSIILSKPFISLILSHFLSQMVCCYCCHFLVVIYTNTQHTIFKWKKKEKKKTQFEYDEIFCKKTTTQQHTKMNDIIIWL